jgi:hypothetical protein
MMASKAKGSNWSIIRRAKAQAVPASPLWAWSDPQHDCTAG